MAASRPSGYREIIEELRAEIAGGQLPPGTRMPTLVELQARFGVSQSTCEKVCAHLEKDGLIIRRRGSGTFVAEPAALPQSGLIGYCATPFDSRLDYFNAAIAQGVESALAAAGKTMVLLRSGSPAGWNLVEGVLYQHVMDIKKTQDFRPQGLPMVCLLTSQTGVSSVISDEFGGIKQVVQHLVELGHRRIACLMEPWPPIVEMRMAGYWAGLREHGIEPINRWMYPADMNDHVLVGYRKWAYQHVTKWLEDDWYELGCTALISQNDLAAVGAVQAFSEAGYRVPEDVSVVGFDGTPVCECVEPHVTSVSVPLENVGARGAELLLEQMKSPRHEVKCITLPVHLSIGGSTGPVPEVLPSPQFNGETAVELGQRLADQTKWLNLLEGIR